MKPNDTPQENVAAEVRSVAASVREELARLDCPEAVIAAACAAAEQAAGLAVQSAESRERARIIRWLRTVANVYADRYRAGKGDESVYWFDQLEAFSHAADAIARRRHARPH